MNKYDIVIVGAGAAGIATASSLIKRDKGLQILIIEPADKHFYQPGWTMVGGGVFTPDQTVRDMSRVIPKRITWKQSSVTEFHPEQNAVSLDNGEHINYEALVVAPGLKLDWNGVEGLTESLGRNGVTSNYRFDLAPYTWKLVQQLRSGNALFTQPAMPIKCAGAPQKAMYLACDAWRRRGVLENMNVVFSNAGGVLFGVNNYVPALMEYIANYGIDLAFSENLVAVDGDNKVAIFERKIDGAAEKVERSFDMIHVCPPQVAPDFIRDSVLANEGGWVDVNQHTLTHNRFENVFSLGDACSTPNAKTAAAVRKQAPIVAVNILQYMAGSESRARYNGYGSCPLTVERGKIVLAEFGYGGAILPSLPKWMINGERPSKVAWLLKEKLLPPLYWEGMMKGREWLAGPELSTDLK